ncbi:titin isoform X2 [Bombyx mori]|uniref:titin isoform X2 n=1 Tax=Bombyx mori TaxID=7091 RepID=UPI002ED0BB70
MSEGDVSLIQDEDLLRRMWQQTEDFSRKKEIRAHMYRLREERLRNLYSPEPSGDGKDLKELSNAGWNVESDDRITDDGHTHVKSVNANIEGRYDVEGGKGQFVAVDRHRQAVTEYQDENSSLKRNESSSNTAAHEQVVRKTDDGTQISSSTTSSSSTSKFQQVSSTQETVPYSTEDQYNQRATNRNELTRQEYESMKRVDDEKGELVSRKVEYPDDNTRVIVETRCLPDGTRLTSTRREFRAPVQSTRSEHRSQTRAETKSSTVHRSNESFSPKVTRHPDSARDIVDSQRHADDYDFKKQISTYVDNDDYSETQSIRNRETNVSSKIDRNTDDNYSRTSRYETKVNKTIIDSKVENDYSQIQRNEKVDRNTIDRSKTEEFDQYIDYDNNKTTVDKSTFDDDVSQTTRRVTKVNSKVIDYSTVDDDRHVKQHHDNNHHSNTKEVIVTRDHKNAHDTDQKDTKYTRDERVHEIRDRKKEIIEKKITNENYQTTYQSDYTQRKISTDWSPSHQAWASTLRSDTPSTTRPSTRASSPGSRTFKSSSSSLRSSVSPDKTHRKPQSRGGSPIKGDKPQSRGNSPIKSEKPPSRSASPSKVDRNSPTRTVSDKYSSTHSITEVKTNKYTSHDGRPPTGRSPTRPVSSPDRPNDRQRTSVSPEKRPSISPTNKTGHEPSDFQPSSPSYERPTEPRSPTKTSQNPDRTPDFQPSQTKPDQLNYPRATFPERRSPEKVSRSSQSPEKKPTGDRPNTPKTDSPKHADNISKRPSLSPDRKPSFNQPREKPTDRTTPKKNVSPDRKPGYMKPTASSQQPTKDFPYTTTSPERTCPNTDSTKYFATTRESKINKVSEDHYKFVDEETKTYTLTDKTDVSKISHDYSEPSRKSPTRSSPAKNIPDSEPREGKPTTHTSDNYHRDSVDVTTIDKTMNKHVTKQNTSEDQDYPISSNNREPSPAKPPIRSKHPTDDREVPDREASPMTGRGSSPAKYGTYEKKKARDDNYTPTEKDLSHPSRESSPTKLDKGDTKKSLDSPRIPKHEEPKTGREPSPSKFGTYNKKRLTEEITDYQTKETITTNDISETKYDSLVEHGKNTKNPENHSISSEKKSTRDSISPTKPTPIKDTKLKTTEFITNERSTAEVNIKTTKDHSRKLLTPSSSPTRKPKSEYEPSTGQSSPTTSVSGFVYFSSPRQEETNITDLDDQNYSRTITTEEFVTTQRRPDILDIDHTSPSKIPCRSPSPEKRISPSKDSLPRKSSLKKPTEPQPSPVEKPPSSFRVTPTDEIPDHKTVKKDKPVDEPNIPKAKPPLERRETYEDRCRKILGMIENEETKTNDTVLKKTDSNSSLSVSPCRSPEPSEETSFNTFVVTKKSTTDIVDFISHEKDDIVKTSVLSAHFPDKTSKTPRDGSPTKLQDLTQNIYEKHGNESHVYEEKITLQSKTKDVRKSPEKQTGLPNKPDDSEHFKLPKPYEPIEKQKHSTRERSPSKIESKIPKDVSPTRQTVSPKREIETIPSKYSTTKYPSRSPSVSPTRQLQSPREKSPSKSKPDTGCKQDEPHRSPLSKSSTPKPQKETSPEQIPGYMKSTTTKYEKSTDDIREYESNTVNITSVRKTTQSPTRKISKENSRSVSPSKSHSVSPVRKPTSPTKGTVNERPDRQTEQSSNVPNYMKTTTATSVKQELSLTGDTTFEELDYHTKSKSPTRRFPPTVDSKEPRNISPRREITIRPEQERRDSPKNNITTKTVTSTFTTDENDTIRVTKTSETKHKTSKPSSSPTRDAGEPVPKSDRLTSPQKKQQKDISKDDEIPRRRPSPAKEVPDTKPDSRYPKDTSPTRKTAKTPASTSDNITCDNRKESTVFAKTMQSSVVPPCKSPYEHPDDDRATPKRYGASPEREPVNKYPLTPPAAQYPSETTNYTSSSELSITNTRNTTQSKIVDNRQKSSSPVRKTPQYKHMNDNDDSPKFPVYEKAQENKTPHHEPTSSEPKPINKRPTTPSPERIPGYLKSTTSVTSKHEIIHLTEDTKNTTIDKTTRKESPNRHVSPDRHTPKRELHKKPENCKETSSSKPDHPEDIDYAHEQTREQIPIKKHTDSHPKKSYKSEIPNYMKSTASIITKHETEGYKTDITTGTEKHRSPRPSTSPLRQVPNEEHTKSEEPRQLRTPSPVKKITSTKEFSADFIMSEREQEVLNKVQKSLRKLSPERKSVSPIREKSPSKMTSLHDLDIIQVKETVKSIDGYEIIDETEVFDSNVKTDKAKEQKIPCKPSSRNVSPTKKSNIPGPSKAEKTPDSPTKSRSISPKKPISERPRSPQVPKVGYAKPKEMTPSTLTRKPTPVTITTTKLEKALVSDAKKSITTSKQVITKTSVKATANKFMTPTNKTETEQRKILTLKDKKDQEISKKESDSKVSRTTSDITLKSKKTTPQRVKSKPEIQVSDVSTKSHRHQKPTKETPAKFSTKPKSATALNTSTDDSDVIIDVGQSKSSRENSPDRICPTPINFNQEDSTPRFPDEVSEPDDDFRRHTHHTIHETESLVDDIVEICEDDELFVKKNTLEDREELNIHEGVSKSVTKLKDTNISFLKTERRECLDEQSDECLLSVTEKVNKFAKGPTDTRDSKSPIRRIVDEYDKDTTYQDDYTKLSVNDKAHLFVETAENVNVPKMKPAQKLERPDMSNIDDSLKSDDCLLSVSDKVNKFVKTAEQFLTESHVVEEKEKKIKEKHEKIMKKIVDDFDEDTQEVIEEIERATEEYEKPTKHPEEIRHVTPDRSKETVKLHPKVKDFKTPTQKAADKTPIKITTLRSSEAVKKAKALFENIASTTQKAKDIKIKTKLTDIGVNQKTPKPETLRHKNDHPNVTEDEVEMNTTVIKTERSIESIKPQEDIRESPSRLSTESPVPRSKSPIRHTVETVTTKITKSAAPRGESPKQRPENDKPDNVPGYLRPTKTSQIKEETIIHDTEVSSRRGSGKFGVELRRTSVERAATSSERRRSVEHPCIEDIFDVELLEQMLEKVVGYEQRRRIRAQIREAKKSEGNFTKTTRTTLTVSNKSVPHKSPDRSRKSTPQKTASPERRAPTSKTGHKEPSTLNGHSKEPVEKQPRDQRPHSPEKGKTTPKTSRQSPEKKVRPQSPTKVTPKTKSNRFNEYASAYMKKVGLNEKLPEIKQQTEEHQQSRIEEHVTEHFATSKTIIQQTSSRDVIETTNFNGKRSPSPGKKQSPQRTGSFEKRSPSPDLKRQKPDTKKEKIIKTVYEVEKKISPKPIQEEKPSWVTNRNLKKVTSETRSFSSKKIEPEKPKYRAPSPSKVISKPLDVITSSYGPGPLDADGKPLFGIKALKKGSSNYQVKGTVIRQEFHSRNGGEPEGTVSVTAYSTEPEELEKLLQGEGAPPSRIHGLAAITTTRKFGGDTGTSIHEAHGKEQRAVLDQFTQNDRRVSDTSLDITRDTSTYECRREIEERTNDREEELNTDNVKKSIKIEKMYRHDNTGKDARDDRKDRVERRDDKKTVRQSSVKSLTEKYIKSASESSKTDRSAYPKAGLILRTATMKDNVSSDSTSHVGLARTDSEHSLGSVEETVVTTTERTVDGVRTTTRQERSFLDSGTKVTGVQDILTRMKNADIVIEDGDTTEDTEARALLNKFLGASVLMAGMQGYVTEKPSGKVVVQQETVRNSGGKVTSTRTVEEFDVDQCWDERVLRKLLDECSDYEQRRRLRARIRTLMAEQEACTSAVTEALEAAGEAAGEGSETRGESLLLPLLQGLLGSAGDRLLAGLGAAPADVVADVRRSLARLRSALAPPAQHPQANALLTLADKLEDALDAADRLDGCRRRPRRRSRAARHTVGVTHEDLEKARCLVDREDLERPTSTAVKPDNTVSNTEAATPERKASVDDVSYHPAVEIREKHPPVAHSISYEPPKVVHENTAVERRVPAPRRPEFFRHSVAETGVPGPQPQQESQPRTDRRPSDSRSSIALIANKFDTQAQAPRETRRAPFEAAPRRAPREDPKRATLYMPPPPTYNFAALPVTRDDSKPIGRFSNNKKLRMKRANTIDIGRPFGGYRLDSDNDDQGQKQAPAVPEFKPQTENDKKFVAFMKKNEPSESQQTVPNNNWSSRFGNIKNSFESREREESTRSLSASSARRFWQTTESGAPAQRPRKFFGDTNSEIVKPPWVTDRREPPRANFPRQQPLPPPPPPSLQPTFAPLPPTPPVQPTAPQAPTKPIVIKPFVARPIPVNQFSHAPMSAFKPLSKAASPTATPAHVWSPPSTGTASSPASEVPPAFPLIPKSMLPISPTIAPAALPIYNDNERQPAPPSSTFNPNTFVLSSPKTQTHPQIQNYPLQVIPSQNDLSAPELVRKINDDKPQTGEVDAQKLQIEFYERQIRQRQRRTDQCPIDRKPPLTYTVTDFTPNGGTSTFVPLQRTPDIEKTRIQKVDYLPDVVTNDTERLQSHPSSTAPRAPPSPRSLNHAKISHSQHNGDAMYSNGTDEDAATEHGSVVTRVMRGPVRGAATITAGVRTRGDEGRRPFAADNLRGVLDKFSSPKHEVLNQIERKKREVARVQAPGRSPLGASRESVLSSSSTGSAPLSRSGSWHQVVPPQPSSPRRVVARAKSMHLLAVPKLYEGGIAREEVQDKKKTVEAYFTGQARSKAHARQAPSYSLGRSRTMAAVTELQFLDESNADDAFEDLVSALA